jgi:serine/threonine protein kinase/tetratricopeptide (TPR) repeat protein
MTDAERHLRTIFTGALDRDSGPQRAAFLDEACGGDVALRERVDALLRAHEQAGGFLEPRVTAGFEPSTAAATAANPMAGTMIAGRYKLIEEIGEGGMGTVWMAQQTEPVRRAVAVKLIKPGMDSKQVLARFEAERQALALMDHPHIAKVLDGGMTGEAGAVATGSGRPFFVMELVKGVPITKYCDEHRLTPRQRLELFVPVCQAVQHAHQKGIIHRDIKPSNILVAQYDGRPVPKVIDFGVAKAAGQQLTDKTLMTGFGAVLGTLEYMSPEQAELNQLDIDTRSDIYSLGVVLYELLTGSTPLDRKRLKQAALAEVLRIIRDEEPPKPSTRLSGSKDSLPSISAQRHTEPAKLTRLVKGELDWMVMKALEKDRNRRYETANGFAMDIQRYLADEPVLACPPSTYYQLRKFVRRNKGPVLAASLVVLALVGGVIGTTTGLTRADQARRREEAQRLLAENQAELARTNEKTANEREAETKAVLDFVENKVFAAARPKDQEGGQGFDVKLADAVKAALPFVDKGFPGQPLIEARLRTTMGTSFWYLGKANIAAEQYEAARTLYTKYRGPNHRDTLRAMHNVARCYADFGRQADAVKLLEETVTLMKANLGPDEPDTLGSMGNLALGYGNLGRYADGVKLLEETLALETAKLGLADRRTLGTMCNLGIGYRHLGQLDDSRKLLEKTLALMKAKIPDDRFTINCMDSLAWTYLDLNRPADALKLHEEALALIKAKVGPRHPDTLSTMYGLACDYAQLGRRQEAIKLNEEILELQKSALGADHPDTLQTMNNLAHSYLAGAEATKAMVILKDTRARHERLVKAEPGSTTQQSCLAWTHGQIGEAEQASHEYAAAVSAYAKSVEMFEKLDKAGTLRYSFFRERMNVYRQRLAFCRKADQAGKDLDFALHQPAGEVPGLLDLRVRHLLKEQKLEPAVESAAKMKELARDKPDQLYKAACAYALCAAAAKDAKKPIAKTPDPEELVKEALALLKQAIAKGHKDAGHMRKNKDLDALRDREDFKELLTELEARTRGPGMSNRESDKKPMPK